MRTPVAVDIVYDDGSTDRMVIASTTKAAPPRATRATSPSIGEQIREFPSEIVAIARQQLLDEGNESRDIAGALLLSRCRRIAERRAVEQLETAG